MVGKDVRAEQKMINTLPAARLAQLAYILASELGNNHSEWIYINHVQIIQPSLTHKNYDCHSGNSMARHNA